MDQQRYRVFVRESGREHTASPNPLRAGPLPRMGELVDVMSGGFGGHGHYACPVIEIKRHYFSVPEVVVDFDRGTRKEECGCHS